MKNSTRLIGGLSALAVVVTTLATAGSALAYQGDPSVEGPDHSPERHEAMEQAFETNDYSAWAELMSGKGRVTQSVNADNFGRFAEARKLAKSGDLEGAKAIRAELGLGLKNGMGKGCRR